MSGQGIKVEIQAITGEERETAWGQEVPQGVDNAMRCVLRAGAQMEDRNQLRTGIDDQPEPEHMARVAQPGSQFIQLQVWEPQLAEGSFV
jgi:hypothetical protein